jgi:Polysulphide reductase, NrfD
MNERETAITQSLGMQGRAFRAWVLLLGAIILWGVYAYSRQFRHGLIETGMRDQISWGLYISNFVFFIGISHAGTLISAILRVTDAGWRRPITRLAEGITVVSLCTGGSMILVDLGRPERLLNVFLYGRIQSPILWDVLGVTTYLTGSLLYFYLPLMPDLAIVASQPGDDSQRLIKWCLPNVLYELFPMNPARAKRRQHRQAHGDDEQSAAASLSARQETTSDWQTHTSGDRPLSFQAEPTQCSEAEIAGIFHGNWMQFFEKSLAKN